MEPGQRHRRRTSKNDGPDPIDIHVGQRLRLARELTGRTQAEIGKALGMSFQVVQKYEQGEIRVSASRLVQLARLLQRPVAFFFEGLATPEPGEGASPVADDTERELVRAFRRIGDREVQQRLLHLVRNMAAQPKPATP